MTLNLETTDMLFSLLAFAAAFRKDTDNYYAIKDNDITISCT